MSEFSQFFRFSFLLAVHESKSQRGLVCIAFERLNTNFDLSTSSSSSSTHSLSQTHTTRQTATGVHFDGFPFRSLFGSMFTLVAYVIAAPPIGLSFATDAIDVTDAKVAIQQHRSAHE